MVDYFGGEYKIVMERPQNSVRASFDLFLRSVKGLLRETKEKIPETEVHLVKYADFIENKIFNGIPESNSFQFSSKNEIRTLIDGVNFYENEKKMYESAMRLSLLEAKNIKQYERSVDVSDTLDSINSLDSILSNRLRRINNSKLSSNVNFIALKQNSTKDEDVFYNVSTRKNLSSPNTNKITYQNQPNKHNYSEQNNVKN